MRFSRTWFYLAVAACYLLSLSTLAVAQTDDGNVTISTNPQGCLVQLEGDLTYTEVTPVKFDRVLSGRYQVTVDREGYERYRSELYFSSTQPSQIDISLVPKTRAKAFFRSVLIPGWGQKYYGNGTKAALFFLGTAASTVGYVLAKDDYDSKYDTYQEQIALRNATTHWSEIQQLDAAVRDAQRKANDAEDMLNIATAVTAGIYVFNLLDTFLFFPEYNTFTEYKALSVTPEVDKQSVGLKLSYNF